MLKIYLFFRMPKLRALKFGFPKWPSPMSAFGLASGPLMPSSSWLLALEIGL